jgi:hypothetical protein
MKLTVRTVSAPLGVKVFLCDESGEPLPNQVSSVLSCSVDRDEITVTFAIDGRDVSLIAAP